MIIRDRVQRSVVEQSNYISRDLSWLKFNFRVLDQVKNTERTIFERLKFLAITASNLDEFFMIRVGSLYNYIDYGKERIDYSGLREIPFRKVLLTFAQNFYKVQDEIFREELVPLFAENGFRLAQIRDLNEDERSDASAYFMRTIFPMLTPMVFDGYHTFPILMNKILIFGVVTKTQEDGNGRPAADHQRLSFVQIPQNLPRFFTIEREVEGRPNEILFVPLEEIIRLEIHKLYRNIEILSVDLFRITRNGDFTLEESDDIDADFIDEIKQKIKTRRTGRVVRIEVENNHSNWMLKVLKQRWELDDDNIFTAEKLLDFTGLWQIINHKEFREKTPSIHPPVTPLSLKAADKNVDLFNVLKHQDLLLHHPFNSIEPVLKLLEDSAEDPNVLAIKLTIYRLAKQSRITNALLKAAENGKHVSVLFEVKARLMRRITSGRLSVCKKRVVSSFMASAGTRPTPNCC
jgi:polyphosphate kinase